MTKLTAAFVNRAKPGRHGDGAGLYLEVSKGGGKSYVFMWKRNGRRRAMGLGSAKTISLATARDLARKAADDVARGINPIEARKQKRAKAITFKEAATQCHADNKSGWVKRYADQWLNQLLIHTKRLQTKVVADIFDDDVVKVLQPLWDVDHPDLALRIRDRIEKVLDWAKVHKYRDGENPARWKGHIKLLMPKLRPKGEWVTPMAAVPYKEIPAFMSRLRSMDDSLHRARALEFCILTAARSGEVFGAQWDEIDFDNREWTVPAARMKKRKAHVVPLSDRALTILKDQYDVRSSTFVFPGFRDNRPMSNTQMLSVLQTLKVEVTVHGFRSSFRDWAGDKTSFPRDVIEFALAHKVGDATEQSYRRGTAFDVRRKLMNAWAAYCERHPQADNVISIERARI